MNTTLLKISFRQQAVFVPVNSITETKGELKETTTLLVANLSRLGYAVAEPLLHALNAMPPAYHASVLNTAKEITGVNKNWTPLVNGWDVPTGESVYDHVATFFGNLFAKTKQIAEPKWPKLQCGHFIPPGTFPLERYNGCPFCGTPFVFGEIENYKQGSNVKMLGLWTLDDAKHFLENLLTSKTALDATQMDSLKLLLRELPVPEVTVGMKETAMAVIDAYIKKNEPAKAKTFFKNPQDIMRYLWYKHTGFMQVVEPKTIIARNAKNSSHITGWLNKSAQAEVKARADLKLKYTRTHCRMVAEWLNTMEMPVEKMCEIMHPKRNMWVRFIRALRLAEYAKKPGFEKLKDLLDKFYREDYTVWQGKLNHYRLRADMPNTLALLKQRPGLFARSLFANMLWFGPDEVLEAFTEVADQVPARLVFTLNMYAENYFSGYQRVVKPLGGNMKHVAPNQLLSIYNSAQLEAMKEKVAEMTLQVMRSRFATQPNANKTMYIDPVLFKIPVSIGDRSDNAQDISSALMGMRFAVEGNSVRLFMQWGNGLKAQHMDMDLSCRIAYDHANDICSFSRLVTTGCRHSGDIRSIPDNVGTAEYIELDIAELQKANAKYVTFTCNAYSVGGISPNMVVGWMNSKHPMKISENTGVAYDPSCVQHQVRIVNKLHKGLVFGVLDVSKAEIIWLEIPFDGQVVQNLDVKNVELLLKKLESKLNIGNLLSIKAASQKLTLVDSKEADEVYTIEWARDTAAVTKLLVD